MRHLTPATTHWYRIELSLPDYEGGEADIIESAFRQIYIAANAPFGMAMLSAPSQQNQGYSVYFTPQSQPHVRALIIAYGAEAVTAPPRKGLRLRVGDVSALTDYHLLI